MFTDNEGQLYNPINKLRDLILHSHNTISALENLAKDNSHDNFSSVDEKLQLAIDSIENLKKSASILDNLQSISDSVRILKDETATQQKEIIDLTADEPETVGENEDVKEIELIIKHKQIVPPHILKKYIYNPTFSTTDDEPETVGENEDVKEIELTVKPWQHIPLHGLNKYFYNPTFSTTADEPETVGENEDVKEIELIEEEPKPVSYVTYRRKNQVLEVLRQYMKEDRLLRFDYKGKQKKGFVVDIWNTKNSSKLVASVLHFNDETNAKYWRTYCVAFIKPIIRGPRCFGCASNQKDRQAHCGEDGCLSE